MTEHDVDRMNDAEQAYHEERARMTPKERLLEALEVQQRCIDNIKAIVEKLGKV